MDSIGNDIVALRAVNVDRTVTPNFYNKILAGSELPLYHSNCPGTAFYQFVWLAWSVKEAAYKYFKRLQNDLVFSPIRTVITAIKRPATVPGPIPFGTHHTGTDDAICYQIEVAVNATILYARSIIYHDELIVTMVLPDSNFSDLRWGIDRLSRTDPESQSLSVRKFLQERLTLDLPEAQTIVTKDDGGIPSVNMPGGRSPISFSHHADFVAYAY